MKRKLSGRNLFVFALALCLLAVTPTQTARAVAPQQKGDAAPAPQESQQTKKPIRRNGLITALHLNALTAKELSELIRQRGVDFKLTPAVEAELREAGATAEVIEAVRESYREPAYVRVDPAQQELAFWNSIQSSDDPDDFKDYLEKYPEGLYAGIARRKLAALTSAAKPAPATPAGGGAATSTTGATRPASPKPAVTNRNGIELVYVSPGEFMMGSENGEPDEKPVHHVTIGEGFYMGKYEVTQAQWLAVMGNNPSSSKGDNLPVEQVSWDDGRYSGQSRLDGMVQRKLRRGNSSGWGEAIERVRAVRHAW